MPRIDELLALMARLRDPVAGCPWDLEQSFATIAPYTIEEAYEVDDAIRREAWDDLREELGDLLLQVVFHAQLARERGLFDFADVVDGLCAKLVRRHPHVFGDATAADSAEVLREWEKHKAAERAAKGGRNALDDVPRALPALLQAAKLARRAERAGLEPAAPASGAEPLDAAALGERLFALAAGAARGGLDPEAALREVCERFRARAASA